MNDFFDPVEEELRGLSPLAPSPRVETGISRRLGTARRARPWLAVAALGACLALVVLLGRESPRPAPPEPDALPSLSVYSRALEQSPEALEAELDRQSSRASVAAPSGATLSASTLLSD